MPEPDFPAPQVREWVETCLQEGALLREPTEADYTDLTLAVERKDVAAFEKTAARILGEQGVTRLKKSWPNNWPFARMNLMQIRQGDGQEPDETPLETGGRLREAVGGPWPGVILLLVLGSWLALLLL